MASIRYQNVNRFGKSILATLAKRNAAKGAIAAAVGAADKKEKELVNKLLQAVSTKVDDLADSSVDQSIANNDIIVGRIATLLDEVLGDLSSDEITSLRDELLEAIEDTANQIKSSHTEPVEITDKTQSELAAVLVSAFSVAEQKKEIQDIKSYLETIQQNQENAQKSDSGNSAVEVDKDTKDQLKTIEGNVATTTDSFEKTKNYISAQFKTMQMKFGNFGASMKNSYLFNFTDPLKGVAGKIKNPFVELQHSATSKIDRINDGIKKTFKDVNSLITKKIIDPLKNIGKKLKAGFASFKDTISQALMAPFRKLAAVFKKSPADEKLEKKQNKSFSFMDGALKKITAIFDNFGKFLARVLASIVIPIAQVIAKGINIIINALFGNPYIMLILVILSIIAFAILFISLAIKNLSDAFIEWMDQLEPETINKVMDAVSGFIANINAVLDYILIPLKIIGRIVNAVFTLFDKIIGPLIEIVANILIKIFQIVGEVIMGILNAIWTLVQPILKLIQMLADMLVSIVEPIFQLIQFTFDILKPILDVLMNIIGKIFEFIGPMFNALMNVLIPIIDIIWSVLSCVWDVISGVVMAVLEVIAETLNTIKPIIELIFNFLKFTIMAALKLIMIPIKMIGWVVKKIAAFFKPLAKISIFGWKPFGFLDGGGDENSEPSEDGEESGDSEEKEELTVEYLHDEIMFLADLMFIGFAGLAKMVGLQMAMIALMSLKTSLLFGLQLVQMSLLTAILVMTALNSALSFLSFGKKKDDKDPIAEVKELVESMKSKVDSMFTMFASVFKMTLKVASLTTLLIVLQKVQMGLLTAILKLTAMNQMFGGLFGGNKEDPLAELKQDVEFVRMDMSYVTSQMTKVMSLVAINTQLLTTIAGLIIPLTTLMLTNTMLLTEAIVLITASLAVQTSILAINTTLVALMTALMGMQVMQTTLLSVLLGMTTAILVATLMNSMFSFFGDKKKNNSGSFDEIKQIVESVQSRVNMIFAFMVRMFTETLKLKAIVKALHFSMIFSFRHYNDDVKPPKETVIEIAKETFSPIQSILTNVESGMKELQDSLAENKKKDESSNSDGGQLDSLTNFVKNMAQTIQNNFDEIKEKLNDPDIIPLPIPNLPQRVNRAAMEND